MNNDSMAILSHKGRVVLEFLVGDRTSHSDIHHIGNHGQGKAQDLPLEVDCYRNLGQSSRVARCRRMDTEDMAWDRSPGNRAVLNSVHWGSLECHSMALLGHPSLSMHVRSKFRLPEMLLTRLNRTPLIWKPISPWTSNKGWCLISHRRVSNGARAGAGANTAPLTWCS